MLIALQIVLIFFLPAEYDKINHFAQVSKSSSEAVCQSVSDNVAEEPWMCIDAVLCLDVKRALSAHLFAI